LDNLKSFLTVLVVLHHSTGAFAGEGWYYGMGAFHNNFQIVGLSLLSLNQAYFMALFFFISAYFSWLSYERKTKHQFLAARYQRLGIPFLVYFFAGGPFLSFFINRVAIDRSNFSYFPDPGPPWFLAVLLIFNEAFVFVDKDTLPSWPSLRALRVYHLVILGVALGAVQVAQMIFAPAYLFMPITFGSLPFDLLFFAAGLQAGKHRWFDEEIPMFAKRSSVVLRSLCILVIGAVVAVYSAVYELGGGFYVQNRNECDEKQDMDGGTYGGAVVFGLGICCGIFCMTFVFVLIDFFQTRANVRNNWTQFLSSSSYAVYLFHPFVVVPITWSYVKILESSSDAEISFLHNTTYSASCVEESEIWLGWAYVASTSIAVVFLLSYYVLKRTPVLRSVL